jgi:hypothetical protein
MDIFINIFIIAKSEKRYYDSQIDEPLHSKFPIHSNPKPPLTHKILFKGDLYHWCGDHHTESIQLQEHHTHIPKVIDQEALQP